jgi:hypothetical protein
MSDVTGEFEDEGTLVVEQHFAIVPEWIIDADISDCAYRLYSILLRYGQTSGQRMPGRALLAQRLKKRSKDTVDRAMKELVAIGAVVVERRRHGRQNLTNRYHLMSTPPGTRRPPEATRPSRSSSTSQGGSRTDAASPLAAEMRPPLAPFLRPPWPQGCGPTQELLPRELLPLHPPRRRLRLRSQPPGEAARLGARPKRIPLGRQAPARAPSTTSRLSPPSASGCAVGSVSRLPAGRRAGSLRCSTRPSSCAAGPPRLPGRRCWPWPPTR